MGLSNTSTIKNTIKARAKSALKLLNAPAPMFGILALACAVLLWFAIFLTVDSFRENYWSNLFVEFGGAIFDILIFGVALAITATYFDRKQQIERHAETIEDYKRWDSEEARMRIAGAIRRLNKLQVFAVNFAGTKLSEFSFSEQGIKAIANSTFYDGSWGEPFLASQVVLRNVNFAYVDCESVTFSPYKPFPTVFGDHTRMANLVDCNFEHASLRNANFGGALLEWTNAPPSTHMEQIDEQEGQGTFAQTSYGPFYCTDLAGASFSDTKLINVDFRDAENILEADFTGAIGLEAAFFDDEETKSAILSSALIASSSSS